MRLFTVGAVGLALGCAGLLILVAGHVLGLFGMLASPSRRRREVTAAPGP